MNNLLSSVSHEVRTPLNAILGGLEVAIASPDADEKFVEKHLMTPLNCAKILKSFMHDFVSLIQSRQKQYLSIKFEKIRL